MRHPPPLPAQPPSQTSHPASRATPRQEKYWADAELPNTLARLKTIVRDESAAIIVRLARSKGIGKPDARWTKDETDLYNNLKGQFKKATASAGAAAAARGGAGATVSSGHGASGSGSGDSTRASTVAVAAASAGPSAAAGGGGMGVHCEPHGTKRSAGDEPVRALATACVCSPRGSC